MRSPEDWFERWKANGFTIQQLVEMVQADALETAALECERLATKHPGYNDDGVLSDGVPEAIRKLKPVTP